MKKLVVIITIATLYTSCKSISMNVGIPDKFAANATQMKISGLHGWRIKRHLAFGNYQVSNVKTGWVYTTGTHDRNSGITTEERLLKVFNMSRDNATQNTRNKYQYTIQDGDGIAEVYCMEKTTKETMSTETPYGTFGKTKNYQYSFSAAILPQTIKDEPWQMVFYNSYDSRKDTTHTFWDRPYIEHEGYVTNGAIRINIRPIITDKVVTNEGKELKTLAKVLMAYELNIDGGVIGIVDVFKDNIWIYNVLDKDMKLIIAAISSAILMRKLDESKA